MDLKACLLLVLITVGMLTHEVIAQQPAFCQLPAEVGVCKAHMYKYAYDPTTNTCREFVYGGCGGNENNFGSKEECNQTCVNQN